MSFGRYVSPRITELEKKLRREPSSLIFVQLAEEYRKSGAYDEAIRICKEGLARHPGYISANMLLGRVFFECRRYKEARAELERVITSSPENLMAHRLLGDIHWLEESWEQAEKRYRMVYMLNPTDLECRQRLQVIESKLREREKAREAAIERERIGDIGGRTEDDSIPVPGIDEPLIDIQAYGEPEAAAGGVAGQAPSTIAAAPASGVAEGEEDGGAPVPAPAAEPGAFESAVEAMWFGETPAPQAGPESAAEAEAPPESLAPAPKAAVVQAAPPAALPDFLAQYEIPPLDIEPPAASEPEPTVPDVSEQVAGEYVETAIGEPVGAPPLPPAATAIDELQARPEPVEETPLETAVFEAISQSATLQAAADEIPPAPIPADRIDRTSPFIFPERLVTVQPVPKELEDISAEAEQVSMDSFFADVLAGQESQPIAPPPPADLPKEEYLPDDLATVTLADLYAAQGHYERAANVYRQLLKRYPGDDSIRARLEEATSRMSAMDAASPSIPQLTSQEKIAILTSWLTAVHRNRHESAIGA